MSCAFGLLLAAGALLTAPAWGQFQLNVVDSGGEHAAPSLYDFGSVYAGETITTHFRLRNASSAPAVVTTIAASGAGFTLSAPAVPATVAPQSALDFSVGFQAAALGSYSAALRSDGVAILLTATVAPRLTYRTDTGAPVTGGVDFGSVVRGGSLQRRFTITNETPLLLTVPAIAVQGGDFSLTSVVPSGQVYQPLASGEFLITFSPHATGPSLGALVIGDRSYPLTGLGADPSLPRPFLSVDLQQIASAQQGLAIVRFDGPVQTSATGSMTLGFQGPVDPTVALASGGRTAAFTVAPGDTQVTVPFQTGTTAGTLTLTVRLGSAADQLSIPIPAAASTISAAQGTRSASAVEIDVTGFDNTRTLGALSFTFYDSSGALLGTGPVRADAGAAFANFFSTSDLGGAFALRAIFPVTGEPARIASCDLTLANSSGATKAPRIFF